jgi:hypothetical protein
MGGKGSGKTKQFSPVELVERQRVARREWKKRNREKVYAAHQRWKERYPEKVRGLRKRLHEPRGLAGAMRVLTRFDEKARRRPVWLEETRELMADHDEWLESLDAAV